MSASAGRGHTLGAALETARLRGARWAPIIEDGRRTTVVELDRRASEGAAMLRRVGLGPGARIGVRVRNTAADIAALFAVWRAGAAIVPLNPKWTAGEEDALLTHASAAAVLEVSPAGDVVVEPRGRSVAATAATDWTGGEEPGSESVAAIAYTSGTTGRPKGVVLTHANLLWAASAVVHTRRDTPSAVAAVVSPLCHLPIFVSHYLARLLSGGTVVLAAFDLDRVVRMIRDDGVTDLPLVPAMIGPLLEHRELGARSKVAKVTVGSALTSMEAKRALADRFGGAEILEAYGQTESTDGLTMTVGREALERPGTVGRAHAPFALAIRSADGVFLEPGEAGEIVARGPTIMRGYLDDEAATHAALRDGWLHTGDLGRLDDEGYLHITGRLKEIIITGGENVSPEEIEGVLSRHPAIAELAVFGVPHERWGEQVTVAVVVRPGAASPPLDDLVEFARPHLARFKLPKQVVTVRELPKTSAGKVKRRELRDQWSAGKLDAPV